MKIATSYKACLLLVLVCLFIAQDLFSQAELTDSSKSFAVDANPVLLQKNEQAYHVNKGQTFIYTKPKNFSFITNLPHDAAGIATKAFKKESIKPLLLIGGATVLLMLADQPVSDGVRQFSQNIHFHNEEDNKDVLNIKLSKTNISLFKARKTSTLQFTKWGRAFQACCWVQGFLRMAKYITITGH